MKKGRSLKKSALLLILVLSMLFASSCGTVFTGIALMNGDTAELSSVKTYDELVTLIQTLDNGQRNYLYAMDESAQVSDGAVKSVENAAPTQTGNHSETNVQVQGVDEADIVKTDGQYIYQVNGNRIIIAKAYPADQMSIIKTITFDDETFYPSEIYLDDKYLVVIGNTYYYIPYPADGTVVDGGEVSDPKIIDGTDPETKESIDEGASSGAGAGSNSGSSTDAPPEKVSGYMEMMPYYQSRETVTVMIFDIEDPSNAQKVRDFEVEGYYISSRKIDSQLYIITNRYIYNYTEKPDEQAILPWYRDSAVGDDFVSVGYDSIKIFPDGQEASYLIVAGLDLNNIQSELNVEAFLGSGQTIYSTKDNLYITVPKYDYQDQAVYAEDVKTTADTDADDSGSISSEETPRTDMMMPYYSYTVTTQIYRFTLNNGKAAFAAKGEIPGTLLNQYSMDEYNGYFRIAATSGEAWRTDANTSQNSLYVLNRDLVTVGSLENLAAGEMIYSVRFIGDRGYMVTYRTVDPLFVIDLRDPAAPKVLGELKIPGYSSYLHPYDENHIIGFGMDTVEEQFKDENGNVVGTSAYQLGMKIAMFDVTDVSNPVEEFSAKIGGRGTYSEILYNPKALLFDREKNLLAFPVSVMENANGNSRDYGVFTFQGMYVYQIDPAAGFILKAKITHLTNQEIDNAQNMWYDYEKTVERGLYIEDTFYTLSKTYIKANSLSTFEELGVLDLK